MILEMMVLRISMVVVVLRMIMAIELSIHDSGMVVSKLTVV
jgi:hypothetical protein